MWEELSPKTNRLGLYDRLALSINEIANKQHMSVDEVISLMMDNIIHALRDDNPNFNEYRFRFICEKGYKPEDSAWKGRRDA